MDSSVIIVSTLGPRNIASILASYLRAVERFRHAQQMTNRDSIHQSYWLEIGYSSLAESIAWIITLSEESSEIKQVLKELQLLDAYKLVRNKMLHTWNEFVDIEIDGSEHNWRWSQKHKTELLKSDSSYYLKYEAHLADKNILQTLDELAEIIWPFRGWEISIEKVGQPGISVGSNLEFDA
jgi:hypothetical protein